MKKSKKTLLKWAATYGEYESDVRASMYNEDMMIEFAKYYHKQKLTLTVSSLQLPSFKELNTEMKKVSEKLYTDAKQTEKNYFEAGFNYCHHIIDKSLNK